MMNRRVIMVYGLVSLLLVSLLMNVALGLKLRERFSREGYADTLKVEYVDTMKCLLPVLKDSTVVRYETVCIATDSPMVCKDTMSVNLPIEQKVYVDSSYTAWVSGYHPSLDSIEVYSRREEVTFTRTAAPRCKRWHLGVTGGAGMTGKGVQPYVGVGVTYSIISF